MTPWRSGRIGLVAVGLVAALGWVVAGIVVADDGEHHSEGDPKSESRPAPAVLPEPSDIRDVPPEKPVAPDEALDSPRAWTVKDPSVEAPPAAVVSEAAPDAGDHSLLRVVTVLNRDGEPEVVVQQVRGPEAAADTVGEAQGSDDVVAVSVDTRVSLDSPAPLSLATAVDTLRGNQWALDRLEAEKVWSDYSSGSGAVVAVIDSGVDGGHLDLSGQLTAAGVDYVTGTGTGRVDNHGHGTHVAGVVAAVRGNAVGVSGFAPQARIMPIRVLDATGAGWSSDIAKGIIYAADNGADVVNLSLGGPSADSATKVAVNYALSEGVIVVAAAGNNRATDNATNYPAAYPGVVAVASTEREDTSSSFSNTGPYVDIAAPGGRILSTVPGGYAYLSGTSMATPYVAAAAALVVDITGGTVTTEQFERRVTGTAWDLGAAGWDDEFGYGLTNPYRLLCSLSTCGVMQAPPSSSPSPSSPSATPTSPRSPTSIPAPPPTPTETISPTSSPIPSPTGGSSPTSTPRSTASPEPTLAPQPPKRRLRLTFTSDGGTVSRGDRAPIRLRVTDTRTSRPVAGHGVMIRGWRDGTVAVRRWVSTNTRGYAATRIRIPATTRFDLRSRATDSTRSATSSSSIRWRLR